MDTYLTLQKWWSDTGAGIATEPVGEARIEQIEARYGVTLPDDFRRYLRFSSPVKENWDKEMGNWWPLDRIRNIPEELGPDAQDRIVTNAGKYLFFLDHCIWCWAWAISCADDETRGKVVVDSGLVVADSFSEFVERYLTDWCSLS